MRDMHVSVERDSFHPDSGWMGKLSDLQYLESCTHLGSPKIASSKLPVVSHLPWTNSTVTNLKWWQAASQVSGANLLPSLALTPGHHDKTLLILPSTSLWRSRCDSSCWSILLTLVLQENTAWDLPAVTLREGSRISLELLQLHIFSLIALTYCGTKCVKWKKRQCRRVTAFCACWY